MDNLKIWETIKHFAPTEFDDPTTPGSGVLMNIELVKIVDQIRGQCDFPFKIDSGYRTPAHNTDVGGVEGSAHTKGLACDIAVNYGSERFQLVKMALAFGIKRIGIGSDFVHLDMDFEKPQGVIWLYPQKV